MPCLLQGELLASCVWDFPWDGLDAAAVPCPEQTCWEPGSLESVKEIAAAMFPYSWINTPREADCFLRLCQVLEAHRVITFMAATPHPGFD